MLSRGFSLIEILIVITIAVVLAVLVMLRLGGAGGGEDPARQLQRLAALLEQQCHQAIMQARPRGVRITAHGYDFWELGDDQWLLLSGQDHSRPREWQGQPRLSLRVDGHAVAPQVDRAAPQIVCQPLGELTPFELDLVIENQPAARLVGYPAGRLEQHSLP